MSGADMDALVSDPVRYAAYQEISDLRKRALGGESFAELAQNYSDDSLSARRGGSMGWVEREFLTSTIDQYVWIGPVGEVSEPIESPFGFHLVLIQDRELSYTESYERRLHEREQLPAVRFADLVRDTAVFDGAEAGLALADELLEWSRDEELLDAARGLALALDPPGHERAARCATMQQETEGAWEQVRPIRKRIVEWKRELVKRKRSRD